MLQSEKYRKCGKHVLFAKSARICADSVRLTHKRKRAGAFKRAAAGLRCARGELTMEQNRYMTIHDASRLWHIEAEELRRRCANGKIQGARMVGGIWMIPV